MYKQKKNIWRHQRRWVIFGVIIVLAVVVVFHSLSSVQFHVAERALYSNFETFFIDLKIYWLVLFCLLVAAYRVCVYVFARFYIYAICMCSVLIFAHSFCCGLSLLRSCPAYSLRCVGKFNYIENGAYGASAARMDDCRHELVEQCSKFDVIHAQKFDFTINNQSKMFVELLLAYTHELNWAAHLLGCFCVLVSICCLTNHQCNYNRRFHLPFPLWHLFDWVKHWKRKINTMRLYVCVFHLLNGAGRCGGHTLNPDIYSWSLSFFIIFAFLTHREIP